MVDIELLKSLVDQGNIRREMMAIEMRVSDLDIGKSLEQIECDALTELV